MTDVPAEKTIRLDQFLKLKAITGSGGQGKALVQGGKVKVNGEVDLRRGRKLRVGDVVEAEGKRATVNQATLDRTEEEGGGGGDSEG